MHNRLAHPVCACACPCIFPTPRSHLPRPARAPPPPLALHLSAGSYVKLDWCVPDGSASQRERATAFAAALDKTGREMWLNFHCKGAYQDWCAADGNSWRIGEDHHDIWSNTRDVIATLATVNRNNQTGPHRWADPDFLMTGGAGCDVNVTAARCPGQTNDEVGSHTITVTSDNTTLTADAVSPSQSC